MASPGLRPEIETLKQVVVVTPNAQLAKRIDEYEVSWQGRAVRQVLLGTALAGAALGIFLFILGCIVDSERTKWWGIGFGLGGLFSHLTRINCLSEYSHSDMPLEL